MPKGDPAGYLPTVKESRASKSRKKFSFGKKKSKPFGKSAPAQKSLRSGGRY